MPHDAIFALQKDLKRSKLQSSFLRRIIATPLPSKSTPPIRKTDTPPTLNKIQSAGAMIFSRKSRTSASPAPLSSSLSLSLSTSKLKQDSRPEPDQELRRPASQPPPRPRPRPRPLSDFFGQADGANVTTDVIDTRRHSQWDFGPRSGSSTPDSQSRSLMSTNSSASSQSEKSQGIKVPEDEDTENDRPAIILPSESRLASFFSKYPSNPVLPMEGPADKGPPSMRTRTVFGKGMDVSRKERKCMHVWNVTTAKLSQDYIEQPDRLLTLRDETVARFIVHELYVTEQSYFQLLSLMRHHYMDPMLAATVARPPIVKQSDIPILFRHLPDMLAVSSKIIGAIDHQSSAPTAWRDFESVCMGKVFKQLESELGVFVRYAVHYRVHAKAIRRASNNVLVLKIEQETLTHKESKRMGMADYLISPFQRVPRYCLLLKDLLRHTPISDPNHASLINALHILTGLAVAMDYVQKPKAY